MTFEIIALVYVLLVEYGVGQEKLASIEYLASGYNIIFGNPHTFSNIDPGFGELVYNLSDYTDGQETPDGKYLVPNGVDALTCSETCTFASYFKAVGGVQSFQESVSQSISGDISVWDIVKFSASEQFQQVYKTTQAQADILNVNYAECCVYKAMIETFTVPSLQHNFQNAIKEMPLNYSQQTYNSFFSQFISAFGTHVPIQINMGSRYGQLSNFYAFFYSSFLSSNLEMQESASVSMFFSDASVDVLTSQQIQQAKYYMSATYKQGVFTVGTTFPANLSGQAWYYNTLQQPMPITYDLSSLSKLLTNQYFPNDTNIKLKQNALNDAYNDYCNQLQKIGKVIQCNKYPPDHNTTKSSIFGGIYELAPNPYTNNYNCMDGFNSYAFMTSDHGYVCLRNDAMNNNKRDPLQGFGGIFSQGNVNPMTGDKSCVDGYTPHYMWKDSSTWVQICLNLTQTTPYGSRIIGGDYTDEKGNHYTNEYTHAYSCPQHFTGYVWDGAGKICLSNVYQFNNITKKN